MRSHPAALWSDRFDSRISGLNWTDARDVLRSCRPALLELHQDRSLLAALIDRVARTPELIARCEEHPLLYRAVIHHNEDENVQVRVHIAQASTRDLMPHDHKSTFIAMVLTGGYIHVWRRRRDEQSGDFASSDLATGTVSVERPGSCYTLRNSLVHQTIMLPGTVTLFVRGPQLQPRWHSASDMRHLLDGYEPPRTDGTEHQGSTAMSTQTLSTLRRGLIEAGVIPPFKEQP